MAESKHIVDARREAVSVEKNTKTDCAILLELYVYCTSSGVPYLIIAWSDTTQVISFKIYLHGVYKYWNTNTCALLGCLLNVFCKLDVLFSFFMQKKLLE